MTSSTSWSTSDTYVVHLVEHLHDTNATQEDVLHLVEISDEIRRKRKSRIREIEIERKSIHGSRPQSSYDSFYEHDVHFDSRRSRYH